MAKADSTPATDLTYPPKEEWTDFPGDILLSQHKASYLFKTAYAVSGIAHLLSVGMVERKSPLLNGSGCEGLCDNTQMALATALDLLTSDLNESLSELHHSLTDSGKAGQAGNFDGTPARP